MKNDDMFSRFDTISTCGERTDGQTSCHRCRMQATYVTHSYEVDILSVAARRLNVLLCL